MEHGHSHAEIAARLAPRKQKRYLKDIVYGGIDGAVTTFAIVAGVEGAGFSPNIFVALGLANIVADGFSMAAGNYAGTKADLDDRHRLWAVEERHIREEPQGERDELRAILRMRGLEGQVLEDATEAISKNTPKWIELMLTDEYNLPRTNADPIAAGIATFLAFLAAGIVPLLPFLLQADHSFRLSILMTAFVFFTIGAAKSRWSLAPWWRSGLETLFIGSLAASLAFVVGRIFHA